MVTMIIDEVNIFVVQACESEWLIITWKTLNMVDRLSLSDTDERAKVMPRSRMMSHRWGPEYSIQRVDNGQLIE
jgi:hypothetical protein